MFAIMADRQIGRAASIITLLYMPLQPSKIQQDLIRPYLFHYNQLAQNLEHCDKGLNRESCMT